jgi:hypothetical protein
MQLPRSQGVANGGALCSPRAHRLSARNDTAFQLICFSRSLQSDSVYFSRRFQSDSVFFKKPSVAFSPLFKKPCTWFLCLQQFCGQLPALPTVKSMSDVLSVKAQCQLSTSTTSTTSTTQTHQTFDVSSFL